ncbi:non-hydrolyzing UDP-N-acetylglucosamine 2-epimerase [Calderihabitans maritimus]|uniref:UDP-N-acetylglucosamine 2-epimerase n=1 Tax=Calderihabitans maritimus TaxID=1246530 RepID=A0A1Z5HX63_9FIRM|nr:UDP-N-acetylglucosamine 2-epimerase (non-hydrolyzing) [Calderihabitans maritimus]GAW94008.1 UDP-N-acetylglucosamine 2-epimerase [Calderihabitans maritimus]
MKIATIVGARPQFIKAAPVSRELRKHHQEIIIHTGQHYDYNMSAVFFEEMDIPRPDYNLGVGSGNHGWQTGRMLEGVEEVLLKESPDLVLVYGDTNSTLAGALAASKMHIPVAHVEAGLRSYNKRMPEEQNRVLTDHISSLLFCPTETAVQNLHREGITTGVYLVGDVMYDALVYNLAIAREKSDILERLQMFPGEYVLATVHRAENTDDLANLQNIVEALTRIDSPVVFPLHPRTKARLIEADLLNFLEVNDCVLLIPPVSYLDMLVLVSNAEVVLTDSGGVQKEAYILGVPCITLREETEWVETVAAGWNILTGTRPEKILSAIMRMRSTDLPERKPVFGDGQASMKIISILSRNFE